MRILLINTINTALMKLNAISSTVVNEFLVLAALLPLPLLPAPTDFFPIDAAEEDEEDDPIAIDAAPDDESWLPGMLYTLPVLILDAPPAPFMPIPPWFNKDELADASIPLLVNVSPDADTDPSNDDDTLLDSICIYLYLSVNVVGRMEEDLVEIMRKSHLRCIKISYIGFRTSIPFITNHLE